MDLRRILYSNIVLSGGSTLFKGKKIWPHEENTIQLISLHHFPSTLLDNALMLLAQVSLLVILMERFEFMYFVVQN